MTYNEFAAAGNAYRQKQAEAAEVEAQRQAEEASTQLESARQDRLKQEAFQSLTTEERAEFDKQTNPQEVTRRLVEQVQADLLSAFEQENEAQRKRELQEWRGKASLRLPH